MTRHTILIATAALALSLTACSGGESASAPPAPPVTVSVPLIREITDWDEYVGRFEAIQSVEVRPRATGYLSGVHFRDGQFVRKGQLLFTVDSRPATAALAQARAQLAQAQAQLANARTELARSQTLAEAKAASQEELESRQAAVRSGSAQVAAAQALVRARQLDLGYTRVYAPIAGRISERQVDVGNTVAADQTVLTRIVSMNPIHFSFTGSEALLLKYQRSGSGSEDGTPVRVKLSDETNYDRAGKLDFVDNAIDEGSGTIHARAVVPNADGFLKPGMFGNLRLEASKPYAAMMVPETAVVSDAARRIVYVVAKDGTVQARPVDLGPVMDGLRVIRSGIARTDKVIIGGIQRARPGQKVDPKPGKIAATEAPAKAPTEPTAGTAEPAASR